jgi:enoyl-CoA hydratase/carnithine racemase
MRPPRFESQAVAAVLTPRGAVGHAADLILPARPAHCVEPRGPHGEISMSDSADTASTPVVAIDGARATIRLNRPKHLNRVQPDDLDALLQLFERIEADDSIRVMVLTGTGRAFSAGFDLGKVAERAAGAASEQSAGSAFEIVANRLEDFSKPTICRLNGGVYGGSTDLALACDFRIGVDSAEMFMPAARLGLHYYPGGLRRYVSRLGVNNAKKLFMTAQKIDAAEMLRIGYLTAVVPIERLDAEVAALAHILAGNAPLAMSGMKRAINEIARGEFDQDAADARARASMRGPEIKEGIAAFSEKRAPRF